jgi:short-subunit dehydrogenase involved in D-alanine esterification of teichoic acids
MTQEIEGKVILITGGGTDIGAETAHRRFVHTPPYALIDSIPVDRRSRVRR